MLAKNQNYFNMNREVFVERDSYNYIYYTQETSMSKAMVTTDTFIMIGQVVLLIDNFTLQQLTSTSGLHNIGMTE